MITGNLTYEYLTNNSTQYNYLKDSQNFMRLIIQIFMRLICVK
jgi:hypothetical protein